MCVRGFFALRRESRKKTEKKEMKRKCDGIKLLCSMYGVVQVEWELCGSEV